MALPLPAVITYSFVAAAVVGLTASFFTDRISVKQALLLAICTTIGMAIGTMM